MLDDIVFGGRQELIPQLISYSRVQVSMEYLSEQQQNTITVFIRCMYDRLLETC